MSVAIIILYGMLAIAGATLLSIWSGTLILRVLALRVERSAVRKLRLAWEAKRTGRGPGEQHPDVPNTALQGQVLQDREPAISAAAAELHPARDATILTIAPVVFASGLVMTWLVGWWLESHRLLAEKHFVLAIATAGEFVVAGSFMGAWWWLGRTVHPRTCPHCGYDMRATHGNLCTECGKESSEYALTRKRPRRILLIVPVFLVCMSYVTVKWEGVRKGLFELVPTTLLIAMMEHVPGSWVEGGPGLSLDETCLSARVERMWGWQYQWLDGRYLDLCGSTQDVDTYVSIFATGLRGRVPPRPHGAIAGEVYKEIGRRLVQGDARLANQIVWMINRSSTDPSVVMLCDAVAPEVIGYLKASLGSQVSYQNTAITAVCLVSVSHRDEAAKLISEVAQDPASSEQAIEGMAQTLGWLQDSVPGARQLTITLALDLTTQKRVPFVSILVDGWSTTVNLMSVYLQLETDADPVIASLGWRGLIGLRGPVPAIALLLDRAANPGQTMTWLLALRSMERSLSNSAWLEVFWSPEMHRLLQVAEDAATPAEARHAILHELAKYLCIVPEPPAELARRIVEGGRAVERAHPSFKGGNEMGDLDVWLETLESKLRADAEEKK